MRGRRVRLGGLLAIVLVAVLAGGAALVLAAGPPSPDAQPADPGVRTLTISCLAPSLGGRLPARVYLPPGYATSGSPERVVYFLHGLPAGLSAYTQNAFVANALVTAHQRAIVVAPQGVRDPDADPEYLDWSSTDDWPQAISDDLTTCVDDRFHTLATRSGRMLVGLSAGGYGALNIGLRRLDTFAVVESWSGYTVATDPSGDHVLKLTSPAAQRAARVPRGRQLAAELARWPSLLGFYVGRSDDRFVDMNVSYADGLRQSGISAVFRTYPGGHSPSLWQAQAPAWLTMGLTYLSTGREVGPNAGR